MPADLRLLTGPVHGRFDPPVNLHWQPGELEFSDLGALRRFYSSALTSACAADDYAQWIDRESLSCLLKVDVVYDAGSGTAPERRAGGGDTIIREEGFDPALRHRLLDGAS